MPKDTSSDISDLQLYVDGELIPFGTKSVKVKDTVEFIYDGKSYSLEELRKKEKDVDLDVTFDFDKGEIEIDYRGTEWKLKGDAAFEALYVDNDGGDGEWDLQVFVDGKAVKKNDAAGLIDSLEIIYKGKEMDPDGLMKQKDIDVDIKNGKDGYVVIEYDGARFTIEGQMAVALFMIDNDGGDGKHDLFILTPGGVAENKGKTVKADADELVILYQGKEVDLEDLLDEKDITVEIDVANETVTIEYDHGTYVLRGAGYIERLRLDDTSVEGDLDLLIYVEEHKGVSTVVVEYNGKDIGLDGLMKLKPEIEFDKTKDGTIMTVSHKSATAIFHNSDVIEAVQAYLSDDITDPTDDVDLPSFIDLKEQEGWLKDLAKDAKDGADIDLADAIELLSANSTLIYEQILAGAIDGDDAKSLEKIGKAIEKLVKELEDSGISESFTAHEGWYKDTADFLESGIAPRMDNGGLQRPPGGADGDGDGGIQIGLTPFQSAQQSAGAVNQFIDRLLTTLETARNGNIGLSDIVDLLLEGNQGDTMAHLANLAQFFNGLGDAPIPPGLNAAFRMRMAELTASDSPNEWAAFLTQLRGAIVETAGNPPLGAAPMASVGRAALMQFLQDNELGDFAYAIGISNAQGNNAIGNLLQNLANAGGFHDFMEALHGAFGINAMAFTLLENMSFSRLTVEDFALIFGPGPLTNAIQTLSLGMGVASIEDVLIALRGFAAYHADAAANGVALVLPETLAEYVRGNTALDTLLNLFGVDLTNDPTEPDDDSTDQTDDDSDSDMSGDEDDPEGDGTGTGEDGQGDQGEGDQGDGSGGGGGGGLPGGGGGGIDPGDLFAGGVAGLAAAVAITSVGGVVVAQGVTVGGAAFAGANGFSSKEAAALISKKKLRAAELEELKAIEGSNADEGVLIEGQSGFTVNMGGGDDAVHITGGSKIDIDMGSGNDEVHLTGGKDINIDMGADADEITVDTKFDTVQLGSGNDVAIFEGKAEGEVMGGAGADTFVFREDLKKGVTITDFEVGQDLIGLSASDYHWLEERWSALGDGEGTVSGLAWLAFEKGVTLQGVDIQSFDRASFDDIFVIA